MRRLDASEKPIPQERKNFLSSALNIFKAPCAMISSRVAVSIFLFISVASCSKHFLHTPGFEYEMEKPANIYELPHSLREISGITFYSEHKLACIQDEKGKIYIYNLKKKEVKESVDFGSDHDYEGICSANDTFFVLHSTGTLFEVTGFDTDSQATKKFDTFLKKENNTEGLCFDSITHSLLIACKGVSHKKGRDDVKEIYAFDLATGGLEKKPRYKIRLEELEQFMRAHGLPIPETRNEDSFFEPSEVAVQPRTHDIYVLSSIGKMVVVLDRTGVIKEAALLDPSLAAHPEGMTFSANGNLYISSEGKGDNKVILEFNPR